eukprot:5847499-Karenia_brevis.AAC.1
MTAECGDMGCLAEKWLRWLSCQLLLEITNLFIPAFDLPPHLADPHLQAVPFLTQGWRVRLFQQR